MLPINFCYHLKNQSIEFDLSSCHIDCIPADLVTFTGEILNGKLHFLCSDTYSCLSTVRFSGNDILKVIRKLDPSKAHGHDKISNHMLNLSDQAICKPLHMIFTSCLET